MTYSAEQVIESEPVMLDVVYLIGGCAFFVVTILYTTACDHL